MMHFQVDPSGTAWCASVRALQRPPAQVFAAHDDDAQAAPGVPARRMCDAFAGDEGRGCPLSLAERRIAARVGCEPMSWEKTSC